MRPGTLSGPDSPAGLPTHGERPRYRYCLRTLRIGQPQRHTPPPSLLLVGVEVLCLRYAPRPRPLPARLLELRPMRRCSRLGTGGDWHGLRRSAGRSGPGPRVHRSIQRNLQRVADPGRRARLRTEVLRAQNRPPAKSFAPPAPRSRTRRDGRAPKRIGNKLLPENGAGVSAQSWVFPPAAGILRVGQRGKDIDFPLKKLNVADHPKFIPADVEDELFSDDARVGKGLT